MFVLAIVIYVIVAFLAGPTWPLSMIGGKAGPIGVIFGVVWIILLIAGINS